MSRNVLDESSQKAARGKFWIYGIHYVPENAFKREKLKLLSLLKEIFH